MFRLRLKILQYLLAVYRLLVFLKINLFLLLVKSILVEVLSFKL